MTLEIIFSFLMGCLFGFLLAAYAMTPLKKESPAPLNSQVIEQALHQQIAFIQQQNMLRSVQLEQARQEAEFTALEKQRLALGRTNQLDVERALLSVIDRGRA